MTEAPSRPTSPPPATPLEVQAAIDDLSHSDKERIARVARNYAAHLRHKGIPTSDDELRDEAFARLLEGKRKWYPAPPADAPPSDETAADLADGSEERHTPVPFVVCLCGVMRSITSEIKKKDTVDARQKHPDPASSPSESTTRRRVVSLADLPPRAADRLVDPRDPEQRVIDRDRLRHIVTFCGRDPEFCAIVHNLLYRELTAQDAAAQLGWSLRRYHTVARRLDRALEANGLGTAQTVVDFHIASEWHREHNAPVRVDQVRVVSRRPYWWRCPEGHDWSASPNDRLFNGQSCPRCHA